MLLKTIPLESITTTNDEAGFESINLFNGDLGKYWKPSATNNGKYFIQLNFTAPVNVEAIDIIFHKDNNLSSFTVEALGLDKLKWFALGVFEILSDNTVPQRIYLPSFHTGAIKITFLQFVEDGHVSLIPEVSELRVYGEFYEEKIPPSRIEMPQLSIPKEHFVNEEGEYVTHNNKKLALVDNISLIKGDTMTVKANNNIPSLLQLDLIFTQPHPDIQLVLDIPNKFMRNIFIQKETNHYKLVLNMNVNNVTSFDLISYTEGTVNFDLRVYSK